MAASISHARLRRCVLVDLNDRWRVTIDRRQWILEVRKGRATSKATGWKARRFLITRTALLRSVAELCGDVHSSAIEIINSLPGRHSRRR